MRGLLRIGAVVSLMALMFAVGWVVAKSGAGQGVDLASLTDLEREFTERMQDVVLVGHFTIEGREDQGGHPDRYEIARVVKIGDGRWRFDARLIYANIDVTLPVTVPLVWAGDTPMVLITDFTIPTLGTFTARVFFYEDRYVGSWQHGEYGGLMYGHIEP